MSCWRWSAAVFAVSLLGSGAVRADDEPLPEPVVSIAARPTPPRSADVVKQSTPPLDATQLKPLQEKIRRVLEMYYPRHQNVKENNPWEVMHAIIAYGVDTKLFKNGPSGETVNAVSWTCFNYPCAGQQLLFLNRGKIDAERAPGLQGHHGQFLAILAQSHVKSDYPMRVGGKEFTLQDLIDHEKETCVAGEELTFKLISLAHYLDSDDTWRSRDGQEWSVSRLLQEELKAPIRGAACGGTHRLMGYSYSLQKRVQRGKPVDGEFLRAQQFLQDYHRYTFSLQNPDGSFSTEWFTRKANENSIDRKLKTSGHILEWIGFSLSEEELRDPRMVKAVDFVASLLDSNNKHKWELGPLGHALHSLVIYERRAFKVPEATRQSDIVTMPAPPQIREAHRPVEATE